MKKILFIDRDGTLIWEPPDNFQIDRFEKLKFIPGAITWLGSIARELDYELVLVTNQDGLGTSSFPEESFWPVHQLMIDTLAGEGIIFAQQYIDRSFESEQSPNRKPNTGMLTHYLQGDYDLERSLVIGDRLSDVQLAKNLGCKAVLFNQELNAQAFSTQLALQTTSWKAIYDLLTLPPRQVEHHRRTSETQISIWLNLDGSGICSIDTGIPFFDHMLDQVARHGKLDLRLHTQGDLHIDEHHTIEDTAIALGEAFSKALGDKRGLERYGFSLPMDDCLAQVCIDFGGRSWTVWEAEFKREKIGDMPTEMFFHFFKSFCDAAKCNLNVKAEGQNEHHKIEAIFKAFARSMAMALKRDRHNLSLPSTKGIL